MKLSDLKKGVYELKVGENYLKVYDNKGNETYFEDSEDYWEKYEYDNNGKRTYYENSTGDWAKHEYDNNGNITYFENSDGEKRGKKAKIMIELTQEQLDKVIKDLGDIK